MNSLPQSTPEMLAAQVGELGQRMEELEARLSGSAGATRPAQEDAVCIVCFSGEWDRLFAAFTIANGALALGQDVHMFFTFWGATAIRSKSIWSRVHRNWMQNLLGCLLPANIAGAPLSKMNFGGLGKWMMGILMKQKGVEDLPVLMQQARDLGAKFYCCDTSLELFGWKNEDLVNANSLKWCGVSTFLSIALKGKTTLFI
jgi:peroxiredoxin family protein